jgi:hypothetical protein
VWLEGLGDWRWPGTSAEGSDFQIPGWIPALPPRLEPATAVTAGGSSAWRADRPAPGRWLGLGLLLSFLAAALVATTVTNPHLLDHLGLGAGKPAEVVEPTAPAGPPTLPAAAAALRLVHQDAGGSVVDQAHFAAATLNGPGSFFIYLPAGYAAAAARYPVLFLLHGRNGHAEAFLEMGIQASLDGLISHRVITPMIVVMVQDAPGPGNWRDTETRLSATYVVEVQELVDRMFKTIPSRSARAIAGSSIGGFGSMNVALSYPLRFAVEESWLGFFDGLQEGLEGDRHVIKKLGLDAFLYGAAEDPVAVPGEDPEFAEELRAVGARAHGVIYPGGHSLEKIREHLDFGLAFASRGLRAAMRREAAEARAEQSAARNVGMPGGSANRVLN